ncbi:methyltransferase domain-containing protein [Pseudofrankia asymbiotica]|uniref:Methyltransferase domain-containing protein n=1 Tax=Pseudofrankia asymbiotica TaxID=1834516 RepID=A0A1V2IFA7_9ACTN|nr:methyltransferase domain-containing protein [Pseudofrankia asymbiotica]ONH31883.1 hypothetical protein BL253_06970 [Pseudofrankia asymbiotica]
MGDQARHDGNVDGTRPGDTRPGDRRSDDWLSDDRMTEERRADDARRSGQTAPAHAPESPARPRAAERRPDPLTDPLPELATPDDQSDQNDQGDQGDPGAWPYPDEAPPGHGRSGSDRAAHHAGGAGRAGAGRAGAGRAGAGRAGASRRLAGTGTAATRLAWPAAGPGPYGSGLSSPYGSDPYAQFGARHWDEPSPPDSPIADQSADHHDEDDIADPGPDAAAAAGAHAEHPHLAEWAERADRAAERAWSWFGRLADQAAARLPTHPPETTGPRAMPPPAPGIPAATPQDSPAASRPGANPLPDATPSGAPTGGPAGQHVGPDEPGEITVDRFAPSTPPVLPPGDVPPGEVPPGDVPPGEAPAGARTVRPTVGYALRGGEADAHRLATQSRALEPGTEAFLTGLGLGPGWRCLDVGCGHGQVSVLLAGRVRPGGRIVGVDGDPASLRVARHNAAQVGARVAFLNADAGGLPASRGGFDLAYCRLLLGHLADPMETLRAMATAVRPGGVVAVEDVYLTVPTTPPQDAPPGVLTELIELMTMTIRAQGGDPQIGPRLPALFTAVGLTDISAGLSAAPLPFDSPLLLAEALDATRDATLDAGLASAAHLDDLRAALLAVPQPALTAMAGAVRLYQVAGRRPPRISARAA